MNKINRVFKNMKQKVIGTAAAAAMTVTPIMASANSFTAPSVSASNVVDGTKNLFSTIGVYGGILWGITAVFTLILAIRNEDNEGRNKAILNLLAAIALLSTGAIISMFF